ncbi:MAG: saccharopine dehydrogenase NADP-binding domain-containing protein [Candidatus Bathyarchaeota archaeon]|nr:saccharopine dehydrogenase NADP-binding domain-containing protein [Candidatus Bathyarchaeota archaeon]
MGAGAQGAPAASILAGDRDVSEVKLADINIGLAEKVVAKVGNDKIIPVKVDAGDEADLVSAAEGMDAIINLTQPRFNQNIMEAALRCGAHYTDTAAGPNLQLEPVDVMLNRQLALDQRFKDADLTAVISSGATPGVSDVLARYACDKLDRVEEIKLRFGGRRLVEPKGLEIRGWETGWSPEVSFLYHATPGIVFENGEYLRQSPFSGYEEYEFPPPIGRVPQAFVDHEEPILLGRFIGKGLKRVEYKNRPDTLAGALIKMGFAENKPIEVKGVKVVPRDVLLKMVRQPVESFFKEKEPTEKVLEHAWGGVIEVTGEKAGEKLTHKIFRGGVPDLDGLRVIYRRYGTTRIGVALPAVISAKMSITGEADNKGVIGPECLDPVLFLRKMAEAGAPVKFVEKVEATRLIR